MCGIAGIVDLKARQPIPEPVLARMNQTQWHRGPDGEGVHMEPGVGLAHRRLAIIDVATGQQPLFNEDGSVVVVFNGEIYNYQTLIPELAALGHVFRTRSDTEVIVHAWEAWGPACVERFRGMFAFALWDRNRETLFLARDRLGVKPLHYALLPGGSLVFGSELKAVLAQGEVDATLDPCAIEEYFALGYVPEPRTIYRAVRKLPPGTTLVLRRGEPVPEPRVYWDVRFSLDRKLGHEQACEELLDRLRESIALRMISEVPLGAFLSGGVDSSAVVALMAGLSTQPVRTCSIAFDDPAYDESAYALQVARQYGTDHRLDKVGTDDFDLIDQLARCHDEPYADSSALPTWRVCQLARRHVTVALSGDGGDETFGGYRRYRMHLAEEAWRSRLPASVRRPLFGVLGALYPKADWAPRFLRARTTFQALARDPVAAYFHSMSITRDEDRARLYSGAFRRTLSGYNALEVFRRHATAANHDDPLALIQYIDLKTYLVGDINTKVDRASMAHSLEVREPLMDHTLVEWMASLPSSWKIGAGVQKRLLKKALEPHLPHEVLYRPKMGFSVPMKRWLQGPLLARLHEGVLGPRMLQSGIFEARTLRRMVSEHAAGQRDHSATLWSLVMFDAFLGIGDNEAGQDSGSTQAHA